MVYVWYTGLKQQQELYIKTSMQVRAALYQLPGYVFQFTYLHLHILIEVFFYTVLAWLQWRQIFVLRGFSSL